MGLPRICAHSLLDELTIVSAPVADTAFPVSRLNDDRTYIGCKPSVSTTSWTLTIDAGVGNTRKCDYLAIIGHDLFDPALDGLGACDVLFEVGDNALTFTPVVATFTVTNNKIIFKTFAQEDDRAYRVTISRVAGFIATIGEIQFGESVIFPFHFEWQGFKPTGRVIKGNHNFNVNGRMTGSTFHYTERTNSVTFRLLPDSFIKGTTNAEWASILESHLLMFKPFVFSWNPGVAANEQESFFGLISQATAPDDSLATQLSSGFRDLVLEMVGEDEVNL